MGLINNILNDILTLEVKKMRHSTYFMLSATFIVFAIAALIGAVICDAMNNSDKSIVFGCIACACTIPAFSSATLLLKSADEKLESSKEENEETSTEENNV